MLRKRWVKRLAIVLPVLLVLAGGGWWCWQTITGAAYDRELRDAIAETDRLDPNWRWDDLQKEQPFVPDEENALTRIRAARMLLQGEMKPPYRNILDKSAPGDIFRDIASNQSLRIGDERVLNASLARHAQAIPHARAVATMPRSYHLIEVDPKNPIGSFRTQLASDIRQVVELLRQDSERAILDGDLRVAVEDIRAMLTIGKLLGEGPTLMWGLVSNAVNHINALRIERLLAMSEKTPMLEHLVAPLEAAMQVPVMYNSLRGARAYDSLVYSALQRRDISIDSVPGFTGSKSPQGNRIDRVFSRQDFRRDHAFCLRMMNRLVENARLPLHEQPPEYERVSLAVTDFETRNNRKLQSGADVAGFVFQGIQRSTALLMAARVAVAVEQFRALHNRWPATLAEIPQSLLSEVPPDPYDGKPFRYRRTESGVVIYAVSENLEDDGGEVDKPVLRRDWPDIGIRLWDPDKRRQPGPNPIWFSNSAADAAIGIGSAAAFDPATPFFKNRILNP